MPHEQSKAKPTRVRFSGQGVKIWGIVGLLLAICVYTAASSGECLHVRKIPNVIHRTSLYGILGIGAAFVIITGGCDMSIGSLVWRVGALLPDLLTHHNWPVVPALLAVLALAFAIGLIHGLLITKMRLQPFVVTLCGLLLYRGIARGITGDVAQGFSGFGPLRSFATPLPPTSGAGRNVFHLPAATLILIVIAIIAAVFLNKTIYGRYL